MAFVRYLKPENIQIHCPLQTKEALLEFLSVMAAESGIEVSQKTLQDKLLEREQTMSTGIGNAVGVPHTLVDGIQDLHAFVITLKDPIPYESIDRKPVCVVFGLFGTPDRPNVSLGALATLGRILRDESFVHALWRAKNREEIFRLLSEKETKKES